MFNLIKDKIKSMYYQKKFKVDGRLRIEGNVRLDNPNIEFGNNVTLFDGVQIWGNGIVKIGSNVAIGKDTVIFSKECIVIGDDTAIAGQCYIIDCDHDTSRNELIRNQKMISKPIYIGKDVWLGAGVKVLKGSVISEGSVVGAMSLVSSMTEPYSINVGIPTRKISERM